MLPPAIESALAFVYTYASHIDEWIVVKKQLIKVLHPSIRTLFSTRHPITKAQQTNDLEREIAARWAQLTGRAIIFKEDEQDH